VTRPAVEKAVIDTLMGQLTCREAIEGLTLRDVTKDGREFETVDALVAEIYTDIVEDFEMGLEYC
jgi:DNA integrity scanning protein DisA with diadenylate cyclase activity